MQKLLTCYLKTILASALLIFISATHSSAQKDAFIRVVPEVEVPESAEMNAYKLRLRKNPNLTQYHFIKLNPLASSQKNGILALNIPGKQTPIITEVSHVEYQSETEYEWIGKTDEDRGTVIIISKAGRICAHISTPEGVFEIFPAPGGLYCLQEIDMAAAGDVGCVTTTDARSGGRTNAGAAETHYEDDVKSQSNAKMQPCQPLVFPRVLVLYTPNALALAGSIQAITDQANLSIAQFNSCIYNSGITSNAVLVLAGIQSLNFSENPSSMEGDNEKLIANVTAQNFRNQYQADVVILLTDGWYSEGNARGISGTETLDINRSYSIVELWHSTAKKTFAHEVGHLYGCRHDDTSGNPAYAQGYNIKTLGITVDRTVMVGKSISGNQASNRLLNFSNPGIQVGGKATGTNNENNALRIGQSCPIVGAFRPDPSPPFVAYLDGPTWVSTQGGKNYELNYNCGSAPYSFSWQYSYDGVNYTLSNTTTDVFTWYFYQTQKIYLKGTVTANGQSSTAYIAVTAQMPNPYKTDASKSDTITEKSGYADLKVSPNPADDQIDISYVLNSDAKVRLEILSQSGDIIAVLGEDHQSNRHKGQHSIKWNCKNVSAGTYLVKLHINETIKIHRVIVLR
jgi:hypothetical protein